MPAGITFIKSAISNKPFSTNFRFRQLFDAASSTYTYFLGDISTSECIIIDPVLEQVKRDFQLTKDFRMKLIYAINTHVHADHVTGSGYLKKLSGCKTVVSKNSGALADVYVDDNDEIPYGSNTIKVLSTPGHTNGCCTFYSASEGIAFTGDTLLIRGCGRTDFQEGNPETLYKSIHEKIFTLPDATKLYPGHDYKGMTFTTVDEEKRLNQRLLKPLKEFIFIMNNLKLDPPKQMNKAIPANKACGLQDIP